MLSIRIFTYLLFLTLGLAACGTPLAAQLGGSSGAVTGVVLDPSGAVVPNATVEIPIR